MKFVPKDLDHSMNVPKEHPGIEFLKLLVGLTLILVSVYVISGFSVDFVVSRISPGQELALAKNFMKSYEDATEPTEEEVKLQLVLDELASNLEGEWGKFQLHINETDEVNALALPGGHIVLYRGLLDTVNSQNELVMIMGHELGHFINRDHLRGMGRGLVLYFVSALILGDQGGLQSFINAEMNQLQSSFSKGQETAADKEGLRLLNEYYGHAGGATDFFRTMSESENPILFALFNDTHPPSENRVEQINNWILERNYLVGDTVAL